MTFREMVEKLRADGKLIEAKRKLSSHLEASAFIKALEPKPVFFQLHESQFPAAANLCASRSLISVYLKIEPNRIVQYILKAIENPTKPELTKKPSCFEACEPTVDLDKLPLLRYAEKDGGKYISSAIVIAGHPEIGENISFHRLMQISKNEVVMRILPRHLDAIVRKTGGELPVAICIGNSPNVLLAAACSVELGRNELEIANTLEPLTITECKETKCHVPAESEFVLTGKILSTMHEEGPFIDLTETYDLIRSQHVVRIERIYHREKPIYHALLPGGLEHKTLMGMPREPTIYREVSKICECIDVQITPGGASWLHAIVKIRKRKEDDGTRAIEAAFKGHTSLKHVLIVDEDINLNDPQEVEWAFATRFQGDRDLHLKKEQTGSSLDPSADPETRKTTKAGFDATKPLETGGKTFEKARLPQLEHSIQHYLEQ